MNLSSSYRVVATCFLFGCLELRALDLWIGPRGNDQNEGTRTSPLATLQAALAKDPAGHIRVLPGKYNLANTVNLLAANSGLIIEAAEGEKPVFSGGRQISNFVADRDGLWKSKADFRFEQLWVNGRRATRARTPNEYWQYIRSSFGSGPNPLTGQAMDLSRRSFGAYPGDLNPLGELSNEELREVQVTVWHSWAISHHKVAQVNTKDSSVFFTGPSQYPFLNFGPNQPYHLENYFSALDAPGEWFQSLDGTVWYKPRVGEDMAKAEVVAPVISQFLTIDGATNVTIRGLRFEHSSYRLPAAGVPDNQSASFLNASIMLDNVREVHLEDLEITHTGQYGVWFRRNARNSYLERCLLEDLGAGGVRIGETSAVPTEAMATLEIVVDNNIIRDGGYVFPSGVGVFIGHSGFNRVSHNEISNFRYSGVSVGWRWGYASSVAVSNRIENNHIHHLGFGVLSDMGGIYTLGPSPDTVLRGNRIHDILSYDRQGRGGWGLYNDEGSTGILSENNVVYRTKTGGYHQNYGRENIIRNNIFAFGTENQIQLSRAEPHRSISFLNNIVYWEGGPLLRGTPFRTGNVEMESNLYYDAKGGTPSFLDLSFDQWRALGRDGSSSWQDPIFVDPRKDDFRLAENSPALRFGFQPFDTNQAGVYGNPGWRKLASDFPDPVMKEAPLPPATPPLAFRNDFEFAAIGTAPANAVMSLENKGESIAVTGETAFSGQRSLKVQDVPGLTFSYNPHFYYRTYGHESGVTTVRFALRAEPGAVLYHEWRDNASPFLTGPSISIQNDKLRVAGQDQMDLPPNQWAEFEISAGLGPQSTGFWDLKVTPSGGQARTFRFPLRSSGWRTLNWLGFVADDVKRVAFFLDDIELSNRTNP